MAACDGKRAGDVCMADGSAGNCVPPDGCTEGACLECVVERPATDAGPSQIGGGGCSVGMGLGLALALVAILRLERRV